MKGKAKAKVEEDTHPIEHYNYIKEGKTRDKNKQNRSWNLVSEPWKHTRAQPHCGALFDSIKKFNFNRKLLVKKTQTLGR